MNQKSRAKLAILKVKLMVKLHSFAKNPLGFIRLGWRQFSEDCVRGIIWHCIIGIMPKWIREPIFALRTLATQFDEAPIHIDRPFAQSITEEKFDAARALVLAAYEVEQKFDFPDTVLCFILPRLQFAREIVSNRRF